MKLIVLNLPRRVTEDELAALFAGYGGITACHVVKDAVKGTSKGFGFVEMAREDDAALAVAALHGSKIGERRIRVKVSQ